MRAAVSCFAIEPSLVSTQVYRDAVTALGASVRELHLLSAWTCQGAFEAATMKSAGENAHVKGIVRARSHSRE